MTDLSQLLEQAFSRRETLLQELSQEKTDCYRLFHGVSDGRPGLSVDRYGPVILAQVASRCPLEGGEAEALSERYSGLPFLLARRHGPRLELISENTQGLWESRFSCREMGLEFAIELAQANRDPQLFLDFRAAKRALRQHLQQEAPKPLSLLNLFAYTCSVSTHAAQAGAKEVVSVDFSATNLRWGKDNFQRNGLSARSTFHACDCVAALWAYSGNRAALFRHKARLCPSLKPRLFSMVVVDPPAFSKGKFATVDLVNDPQTVYGPAWDVVEPGGLLLAANNSARVKQEEFETSLRRMIKKRTGAEAEIAWIKPDADFPSFDGEPPLKVAFCRKAL